MYCMAMNEDPAENIRLADLLDALNGPGNMLETNLDGSVLTSTPDGETVLVYYVQSDPATENEQYIYVQNEQPETQEDLQIQALVINEEDRETALEVVDEDKEPIAQCSGGELHKFINEGILDQSEIVVFKDAVVPSSSYDPVIAVVDQLSERWTIAANGAGANENFKSILQSNSDDTQRKRCYECEICNVKFDRVRALRKHHRTPGPCKRMWTQMKPLICNHCGKSYSRILRYRAHLASHEDPNHGAQVPCTYCSKPCRTLWEMVQHRMTVHGISGEEFVGLEDLKCEKCERQFKFRKSFEKHKSNGCKKMKSQLYKCEKCGKRYTGDKYLSNHLKSGNCAGRQRCVDCDFYFNDKKSYDEHLKFHETESGFECSTCEESFPSQIALNEHECEGGSQIEAITDVEISEQQVPVVDEAVKKKKKTIVVNVEVEGLPQSELVCRTCGRSFFWKWRYDKHVPKCSKHKTEDRNQTSSKPEQKSTQRKVISILKPSVSNKALDKTLEKDVFKCNDCEDMSFPTLHRLTTHRIREHDLQTEYKCQHCGKCFVNSEDLIVHELIHTDEKPIPCQYCDSTFRTLSHLAKHTRSHTGEKPYSCRFCDKRFSALNAQKQHLLSHTGEKPFECDLCDKAFFTSGLRTAHRRIHTDETIHVCQLCQSAFIFRHQMRKHELAHEEKKIPPGRTYCHICDDWFGTDSMRQHRESKHGVHVWFQCRAVNCPRRFVDQKHCLEHEANDHSREDDLGTEPVKGTMLDKPDLQPVCTNCSTTFFSNSSLSSHESTCCGPTKLSNKSKITLTADSISNENTNVVDVEEADLDVVAAACEDRDDDDEEEEMEEDEEDGDSIKEKNENTSATILQTSSESSKDLTCPRCERHFKFFNGYSVHVKTGNCKQRMKMGIIRCENCSAEFSNYVDFYQHRDSNECTSMKKTLSQESDCVELGYNAKELKCNGCGQGLQNVACYAEHVRKHHKCNELCLSDSPSVSSSRESSQALIPDVPVHYIRAAKQRKRRNCVGKSFFRMWVNLKCQSCQKLFHTAAGLKLHQQLTSHCRQKNLGGFYPCNGCARAFTVKSYLLAHKRDHSLSNPDGKKCDVCNYGLEKHSDEIPHLILEHGKLPFRCRICGRTASNLKLLDKHVKEEHKSLGNRDSVKSTRAVSRSKGQPKFRCGNCGETFFSAGGLSIHAQKHSNIMNPSSKVKKIRCKFCGLRLATESSLRTHHNNCKMNPKMNEKFPCSVCVLDFYSETSRNRHMSQYHTTDTENTPVKCSICSRVLPNMTLFKMHARFHGAISPLDIEELQNTGSHIEEYAIAPRRKSGKVNNKETSYHEYRCSECDTRFISYKSMIRHVRVHKGQNLIKKVIYHFCELCEESFDSSEALSNHFANVHGDALNSENTEVRFMCSKCLNEFESEEEAILHISMHNEKDSNPAPSSSNMPSSVSNLASGISNMPTGVSNLASGISNMPFSVSNMPPIVSNLTSSILNMPPSVSNLTSSISNMPPSVSNLASSMSDIPAISNLESNISNNSLYSCQICHQVCDTEQALLYHEFSQHPHSCLNCSVDFPSADALKEHVCSTESLHCEQCGTRFESSLAVSNHRCNVLAGKRKRKRKTYEDYDMTSSSVDKMGKKARVANTSSIYDEAPQMSGDVTNVSLVTSMDREAPPTQYDDKASPDNVQHLVVYAMADDEQQPDILQAAFSETFHISSSS